MKIGVAIPCYYGHIDQLFILLDSIEKQTILPDKVVVSSSSTQSFENKKTYSFPLEIIVTEEKQNAARNRNVAVSKLQDMDYITFIDADDVMHPQRIEVLLEVFKKEDSDIILHNFYYR
jgi:glycosyltransferase involved in cell wall biosynthesis